MKYNHAFDIAFSVVSEHPTGEDVTAEQVREVLIKRVIQAYDSGELLEAIGAPFDTYEEEVYEKEASYAQEAEERLMRKWVAEDYPEATEEQKANLTKLFREV